MRKLVILSLITCIIILLLALIVLADYDTTVLSFSPDYRWQLDGDETDDIDSGTSNGGNDPSWVTNIIPESDATYCGDYDGSSDVSQLPSQTDINTGTTTLKSISLWFEADTIDTSGNGRILWEEGATYHGIGIYVYDGEGSDKVYVTSGYNSGAALDTVSAEVSTGTLYHLVVTIDYTASEMILYLNGDVADTESSMSCPNPFSAHSSDPAIGGADSGPRNYASATLSGYFDGRIADVVYYAEQTVLSATDVEDIYNAGIGGGGDTCSCPASGDWVKTDDCPITEDCDMQGNDVYFYIDTDITATIYNYGNIYRHNARTYCWNARCFE